MTERTAGFLADAAQMLVLCVLAVVFRNDADVMAQVKGAVLAMLAGRFVVRRIVRATAKKPPSDPPSSPSSSSSSSSPSSPPPATLLAACAACLLLASCAASGYAEALTACVEVSATREEYSSCKRGVNARYGRDAGALLEDAGHLEAEAGR